MALLAALTGIQLVWWAIAWRAGAAPLPYVGLYLAVALGGVSVARVLAGLVRPRGQWARWPAPLIGAVLVGLGASLFLPLKYAIPSLVPFWLDVPLAAAERSLFGTDPWQLLDRILGRAIVPVDRVYGLWLPTQLLGLFLVMIQAPSPAKSRALIAYGLAWFALGVAAAMLCSSAGPIFYDRLFGGGRFALLDAALRDRGAWVVVAESDAMWKAFATRTPSLVAGISAFPSMHVAISLWLYLAARTLAPRAAPLAGAYFLFMWIASVQLGWHYVGDGLAGAAGMLGLWLLAGPLDRVLAEQIDRHRVDSKAISISEP
ncbi:MAG: phosphatase PAP2 family protein [Sphingomicrobium sp.]